VRALLADRRVRLFLFGNAVSDFGDAALFLALAVWVKELTGSTSLAGLCMCAISVGALFAPLTGVLVDRTARKPLLIWTYLATALLVMALLFVHDRGQIWLIMAVTFVYGLSGTVSGGSQSALLQLVVPTDLRTEANSVNQTMSEISRLATPIVGVGLLAWLGGHAVAVMDAGTFIVAALCLLAIRVEEQQVERVEKPRWSQEIASGFRYLLHSPLLRQTVIVYAAVFLICGLFSNLEFEIVTVGLHHPITWLSVLVVAQGIGGIAGGLTLISPLFAIPETATVVAATSLSGLFLAWFFVGVSSVCLKNTPNELMGRVNGVNSLTLQVAQAGGFALGAALVADIDYRTLCYLIAAAFALAGLYLGTGREQRATTRIRNLPEANELAVAVEVVLPERRDAARGRAEADRAEGFERHLDPG
jgi:MFS family permease